MANTLKHDRAEVLDKATNLFWEKGFHATSMRNLQDHIDMRPGSIYAAFGSKEGLFKESLNHYAKTSLARLTESTKTSESPLAALKAFIKTVVLNCREDTPSEMCMLVKAIAELTEENGELLDEAKGLLKAVEQALTQLIEQAQAAGEVDSSKDAARLARYIQMQLIGLRVYARVSPDEDDLVAMIDDSIASMV
ncbi:TetR/AcrR family transcriptional regulator [Neptuniibacter sp. QD48_11]|uniref:TetR/AcrR family transcriptional regulator n=1 Tax=unclassified Neptuniibacter TaxID=2630693 RepID=UPI0039F54860